MAYRGVNVGGWLVAEKWMTLDLFKGVEGEGERAIGRELPHELARIRIEAHRRTFITEADFVRMRRLGMEFVRLPFGYWLFEPDKGYIAGEKHLKNAMRWAQQYGLGVVFDFHGLPGSQNGRDHSGEVMAAPGFYREENIEHALTTLAHVAKEYGGAPNLMGIEVINEPSIPSNSGQLLDYYEAAYKIIDSSTSSAVKVIVGDNFNHVEMHEWLEKRGFGPRIVHDIHLYQLFTPEEAHMTLEEHIHRVQHEWRQLLTRLGNKTMVGEWTPALPPYAIGGADVMGTLQRYHDVQTELFEELTWAYAPWSWKVPDSSWWSYGDSPFIVPGR